MVSPNDNKTALFLKKEIQPKSLWIMKRIVIYSILELILFVFSWELSCFWHVIHLSVFLWVVICALWCFWRQNWMCVCYWSGKIQLGAHCSLKKSLPVISVLQFNTHTHRCWEWWKCGGEGRNRCWGEMMRELLSPSTLQAERESVRERLLRDRPVKGGRMGEQSGDRMIRKSISSVEKNPASDRFWERHNTDVVVKRQMERKEDFEIRKSPLAEKTRRNGAKAITADSRCQWLQGCMDNKSPAWTEIVLENSRIIQMPSAHQPCPYFPCLFCLTVC